MGFPLQALQYYLHRWGFLLFTGTVPEHFLMNLLRDAASPITFLLCSCQRRRFARRIGIREGRSWVEYLLQQRRTQMQLRCCVTNGFCYCKDDQIVEWLGCCDWCLSSFQRTYRDFYKTYFTQTLLWGSHYFCVESHLWRQLLHHFAPELRSCCQNMMAHLKCN